jgi:hypothetical protein
MPLPRKSAHFSSKRRCPQAPKSLSQKRLLKKGALQRPECRPRRLHRLWAGGAFQAERHHEKDDNYLDRRRRRSTVTATVTVTVTGLDLNPPDPV